jgi:hypothetical protein
MLSFMGFGAKDWVGMGRAHLIDLGSSRMMASHGHRYKMRLGAEKRDFEAFSQADPRKSWGATAI